MKNKPILIVAGEPKSIFFEIFFKSLRLNRFKSPLILISSLKILKSQIKKNRYKKKIRLINTNELKKLKIDNNCINLINVNYNSKDNSKSQSIETKNYLQKCFKIAFNILKMKISYKLLNGPINKSNFLNKKYLGITEYISEKFNKRKFAMLIYNEELSVCPITTHLPLKLVTRKMSKKIIKEKVYIINEFYKKFLKFRPRIALAGLNPHCESIHNFNEDQKILLPAIRSLKKIKVNIKGPFPTDTLFLKKNRKNYDVIVGMYHDQVLTPIKTLFEYNAINITLGLPLIRVSPDHGPNKNMIGKNKSSPISLIKALSFLDKR